MFDSTNTTTLTPNRSLTFDAWTHVLASWSYVERITTIFIDGKQEATNVLNMEHATLMPTNHQYDIGLDRNESKVLHAYIRELTVFAWPAIPTKRVLDRIGRYQKRDAVWTGLNDLSQENTFTFSDGTPLSFTYWNDGCPNDKYKFSDCVLFSLETGLTHKWLDGSCGFELPYICRRKMN
ncbi:uncharacterized protein LOC114574350 [Exaiptasia diaphana]|uniref:C-type lectin domain-containing protein n=1 Tax=Exaiptasia diaphana TaxID=2652724 RepID=A0A913YDB4_EXADI|nr:uncharacterized protein LOC114574350 [Exaiptasia diaphana]